MKLILRSTLYVVVLTVILGGAYPAAVTGVSRLFWREKADGSFVTAGGRIVGSELIGQNFKGPQYLRPRPSAAGKEGYDATASAGTNKGPTDEGLAKAIEAAVAAAREDRPGESGARPSGPRHHLGLRLRSAPLSRRSALAGGAHRSRPRRDRAARRRGHPPAHRAAHARAPRASRASTSS